MSYTVKPHTNAWYPEWRIYDGDVLIGKAFSASVAAEFAASGDLAKAIEDSMEYLDSTLGPCEDGCECILHGLRAAIDKARGTEAAA